MKDKFSKSINLILWTNNGILQQVTIQRRNLPKISSEIHEYVLLLKLPHVVYLSKSENATETWYVTQNNMIVRVWK